MGETKKLVLTEQMAREAIHAAGQSLIATAKVWRSEDETDPAIERAQAAAKKALKCHRASRKIADSELDNIAFDSVVAASSKFAAAIDRAGKKSGWK